MKADQVSTIFIHKKGFLEACSKWKEIPPKPSVYILVVNETFQHDGKVTDILYIGETMHLGGIDGNCRLWDYHTKATPHEREIVEVIRELEEVGKTVEIWWCYQFPDNHNHKSYEKFLLQRYKGEHGKPPKLNKI